MQWLAELCVKRPVFATVLSLVILVVGGVFYTQLGVDQFPKIDFPVVVVITTLPGRSPEDIETRHHRQDRGGGQHHQRHRRAALATVVRGRLAGRHPVRPREERRRRRAGGAAEGQHGAARAAPRASTRRIVHEVRPRRRAGPLHRAARAEDATSRDDHRHRRPRRAPPARVGQRRRPGRASSAGGSARSTCRSTR